MRFREANQRFLDVIEDGGREQRRVPFICECADDECLDRVEVAVDEWEAVASQPNHFLMKAGHQRSEGEEVVGSVGEYDVALKPDWVAPPVGARQNLN
jgi:hypothetical protein